MTEKQARTVSVFHVINGLGTGGAERSLAEMIPHFRELGVESSIVYSYRRGEGVHEDVQAMGIPIHQLAGSGILTRTLSLRRLIRSHAPDLLHTTIFESDVVGRLAAMGTGIPVLTSLVNTSYVPSRVATDPNVSRVKLGVYQWIDGLTARNLTTWFHAITHAVKNATVADLGVASDRVTVIERGRDPARLGEPAPERTRIAREGLGIDPDAEVILNIGRQEFQKGQAVLLEALRDLQESRPNLICLIAGRTGNASPSLQELHETLPAKDRVRFLGHRDDIPELLAAADLFVFPSHFEGLGGSVIEAMALGLPVVCSRIPALEEVVDEGENALLVAPGSPQELARAISTLLDDAEMRKNFSAHSRKIFLERFTLKMIAEKMAALFRTVAAKRTIRVQAGSEEVARG